MTTVHRLFPVPVAAYNLGRKYTAKEMSCIRKSLKKVYDNVYNKTSLNRNALELPELRDLKQFCLDSLADFGANVMQLQDGKPYITQSWLNISKKGEQHHRHKHPNSLWSGVLYISVGDDDRLMFHNESKIEGSFQMKETEFNLYNSPAWWLPTKPGDLLIFPSQFIHSVPPTESEERISLAFNTFPTESIGMAESLALLPLN